MTAFNTPHKDQTELKHKVLFAAAKLFLEKGYTNATTREIARAADVNVTTMNRCFGSKDGILAEITRYVLEGQFSATKRKLAGLTTDPILFYAAETTLQLYMVESTETMRDIYSAAYSLPVSSDYIQKTITAKLAELFRDYLPELKPNDFYRLEIASGGIMRGFMTIPCNIWFTMEQKVASFLECTFKIYDVPKEKIAEAVAFVSGIDFKSFAQKTIAAMLKLLGGATPEE